MSFEVATDVEILDPKVLLGVLSAVKAGDFTARMPVHWTGAAGKIAQSYFFNVVSAQGSARLRRPAPA